MLGRLGTSKHGRVGAGPGCSVAPFSAAGWESLPSVSRPPSALPYPAHLARAFPAVPAPSLASALLPPASSEGLTLCGAGEDQARAPSPAPGKPWLGGVAGDTVAHQDIGTVSPRMDPRGVNSARLRQLVSTLWPARKETWSAWLCSVCKSCVNLWPPAHGHFPSVFPRGCHGAPAAHGGPLYPSGSRSRAVARGEPRLAPGPRLCPAPPQPRPVLLFQPCPKPCWPRRPSCSPGSSPTRCLCCCRSQAGPPCPQDTAPLRGPQGLLQEPGVPACHLPPRRHPRPSPLLPP